MGVCLPFSKSFRCRFRDITLVGHFAHCRSKQHIVGSQQRVERGNASAKPSSLCCGKASICRASEVKFFRNS